MQTKPLLFGIVGFIVGGLLVSVAASTFEKPEPAMGGMSSMASTLEGKQGEAFDKAFIEGMIEHHQDAIDMARMAQKDAQHQEIKDLSQAIIDTQQQEIDDMRDWQRDWGYDTATGDKPMH